ncbi:MAG: TonB-dependent receptor [Tannerellaceae bacterium]|nr:TonB-dependent receptor [Tannerellaceae bacterium]
MKLSYLMLFLFVFQSVASSYAQSTRIDLNIKQSTLKQVFREIESKTEYTFFYNDEVIDLDRIVNVQANKETIESILNKVLTSCTFKIENRNILLIPNNTGPANLIAQQAKRRITGIVADERGEPVIGANIMEKGTSNGVITDVSGQFFISLPDDAILHVSYIGYVAQEFRLGDQSSFNIVLKEDLLNLDEVVVVGYGTVKKRDLTGSIASVDASKIASVPSTTASEALQGRIPGIVVANSDWSPGTTPNVMIRGKRSITASNDPLYVVDGVPVTGGINEISPADIESMEILKDASATAIYGARGANGVILISTKQGKSGKTQIDYNGYAGAQTILNQLELWEGPEYAEYSRESYRNTANASIRYNSDVPSREFDLIMPGFTRDATIMESVMMGWGDDGVYDPSRVRSSNYMDQVTRTGMVTDHQLSIRGGGERTNFLASGTYNKNNGLFKDQSYERYSIRLNLNHEINNYVKIGAQTQYSRAVRSRGSNLASSWRLSPLAPLRDDEGEIIPMPGTYNIYNPLMNLEPGAVDRPLKTTRYLGSYFVDVKLPVDGLKFRSNLGIDSRTVQDYEFWSARSSSRGLSSSSAKNATEKYTMFTLENMLFYDKTFNNKHTLGVTLLQSIQEDQKETNQMGVDDLPADILKYYDISSALRTNSLGSEMVKWNMASFMGRVNYNYLSRYLLTLSARYDGSSRLADGHKWVLFPSAALAWRINEEEFMQGAAWLDNLKLRVGFGKTGNSAVDPYQTKGKLRLIKYSFDNGATETIGYAPDVMANNLLTWETTDQWNLGLDFGIFRGRINGTVELYLQNTHDLLLKRQLPVVSGFSEVLSNVGKTSNKGIELSLNTLNVNTKNFQWSTDLTLSANKEEIVELYNGKIDDIGSKWFIGQPVNVHYDYKKTGIWQNTPGDLAEIAKFAANGTEFSPGDIKLQDVNGDYKITDEDKQILGNPRPKLIAGMVNTFHYKDFDLSVFLYASFGAMLYNDVYAMEHCARNGGVKVDYWTPTNPTNAYPRPSIDEERPVYITSTYYEKANYLRARTMTLGYTLPKNVSKKFLTERLRLYFTAQNPFIFTNYSGIDPEASKVNADGNPQTDGSGYGTPSVSSWIVGINLTF